MDWGCFQRHYFILKIEQINNASESMELNADVVKVYPIPTNTYLIVKALEAEYNIVLRDLSDKIVLNTKLMRR